MFPNRILYLACCMRRRLQPEEVHHTRSCEAIPLRAGHVSVAHVLLFSACLCRFPRILRLPGSWADDDKDPLLSIGNSLLATAFRFVIGPGRSEGQAFKGTLSLLRRGRRFGTSLLFLQTHLSNCPCLFVCFLGCFQRLFLEALMRRHWRHFVARRSPFHVTQCHIHMSCSCPSASDTVWTKSCSQVVWEGGREAEGESSSRRKGRRGEGRGLVVLIWDERSGVGCDLCCLLSSSCSYIFHRLACLLLCFLPSFFFSLFLFGEVWTLFPQIQTADVMACNLIKGFACNAIQYTTNINLLRNCFVRQIVS